ncbi:hypothetical protein BUALT_Bualt13G0041300 [Buddleja alternifolia]|uniref:Uncharacterized protein n=1 Tax=Buddleja alternifolia TaxID=168488 RepID=A0AAV6WTR2_9LAMI|nr:hypothetical protein BUALT_Bualt13G0041300 [Buddleja alternifolia]
MEKIEDYQGRFDHHGRRRQAVYRKKKRSPCMQPSRKQKSNMVWMPAVPSWEKEFCYKIGSFTWENFLEAKKATIFGEKVFEWDDSAAKEAFDSAKNRFFAQINGLPIPDESDPNPDLYIDEIDSEAETDSELLHELELAKEYVSVDQEEENRNEYVPDWYHIPIEDIKPTGWDIEDEEFSGGKVLTGLVIGY